VTEEVLFQNDHVSVTPSRVLVGSTTYALRNITSVRVSATRDADTRVLAILVGGFLVWILLSGLLSLVGVAIGGFVFLAVLVFSIWLSYFCLYSYIPAPKTIYHCVLATSGDEVQALSSTDFSFIEGVVNAISNAIIRVGA
jgi:hypothetical protein